MNRETRRARHESPQAHHFPATRLEAFMRSHHIGPAALERASRVTRPHLLRLRLGKAEPGRRVIVAITRGCRQLANDPSVTALDLFELE